MRQPGNRPAPRRQRPGHTRAAPSPSSRTRRSRCAVVPDPDDLCAEAGLVARLRSSKVSCLRGVRAGVLRPLRTVPTATYSGTLRSKFLRACPWRRPEYSWHTVTYPVICFNLRAHALGGHGNNSRFAGSKTHEPAHHRSRKEAVGIILTLFARGRELVRSAELGPVVVRTADGALVRTRRALLVGADRLAAISRKTVAVSLIATPF